MNDALFITIALGAVLGVAGYLNLKSAIGDMKHRIKELETRVDMYYNWGVNTTDDHK